MVREFYKGKYSEEEIKEALKNSSITISLKEQVIKQNTVQPLLQKYKERNNEWKQIQSSDEKFLTNAESTYRDFWNVFDKILLERSNPFYIIYKMSGQVKSWANVNKNHAWNHYAVDLSLQSRVKKLRIDLYVDDKNSDIGQILLRNKNAINNEISVPLIWKSGDSQAKTLRVEYYLSFANCSYRETIEKALPIIMEFIAVAKKYGRSEFFDF